MEVFRSQASCRGLKILAFTDLYCSNSDTFRLEKSSGEAVTHVESRVWSPDVKMVTALELIPRIGGSSVRLRRKGIKEILSR